MYSSYFKIVFKLDKHICLLKNTISITLRGRFLMNLKLKHILILVLLTSLVIAATGAAFAYDIDSMTIEGGSFSTGSGLEDKTYATIYVGEEYSGADVIIQIFYSRDGSLLNHGNMVPKTVDSKGCINVASADSYKYYPDFAEINLYDSNSILLDSMNVSLEINSNTQTFGSYSLTDSTSTSSGSDSSSNGGSTTSYNSGTSDSYVGNSNTGKFHAPGCGSVNKMNPSNKVYFSSRDEAVSSGYSPCGNCYP